MKGKGKRLAALLTLIVLTFSSVLVVSADSNTKLIQRSTSVSNQNFDHTEVSVAANTPDRTGFTLTVKRADDSFTLYNLVNIVATDNETNGITSIDVQWITPVANFIQSHEQFASDPDYASPTALGAYTVDQSLSGEAKENAEKAAKAAKEKKLITLINAMKSDYEIIVDKNATAIGQMTAVAHLDGASVTSKLENDPEANLNDISGSEVQIGLSGEAYEISRLQFGLYFVDATNPARASGGGYQPVVVELIPEQTGPSGHWYIDNNKTATLKNESISIEKKINGSDSDIIREGEIVSFQVDIDIPLYTKTNNTFDFTKFCAFDDMSQGFTLIATSATLTFFDSQGREYHPMAALVGDSYGNKTARDTNGTYVATLIGYSYPVYYSGEENQKAYFYVTEDSGSQITVWVNNGGQLKKVSFTKNKVNGTYTFNTNDLIAINNQLGADNQIPTAYITSSNAPKFVLSETTKSLISVEFNYETLMNEDTYVQMSNSDSYIQHEEFTLPSKVVVNYDALVNDSAYLGNNDNTNKVTAYYIEDTSGTTGTVEDEVVAWTYGANIVKVDGEAYSDFEKLSSDEQAAQVAAGKAPYLEGAVFDIYRLDTTYCGGTANADQNTAPVERAYNTFTFYDDSTYPVTTVDSNNATKRYTESYRQYAAVLQKAMKYEMTQKMALTDPVIIGGAIQSAFAYAGNYMTADNFTKKYNFADFYTNVETLQSLHEGYGGNILLDYIVPKATTLENGKTWDQAEDFESGFVVFVPRWVESGECAVHSGEHWHLDAYSLFWADTTSIAEAEGVLLTGFDPNQYLMIEKTAPAGGYNKLSTAIYFEVNQISDELYTERGNSYASFISDEYENALGETVQDDNQDGIYHFVIKNYSGLTLPSTGGIGTLLFTLIGLIIMGGAIVFVIARRKKLVRNAASFMAIALMIASLLVPSINVNAATTISLGNSDGVSTGVQRATPNGTAEFIIHLRDSADVLSVYRIASVSYDDTTMTWSDLEWVPNLYSYLGNYSLDTGNDDIPTTPQQFTELNAKEQADFLTWTYNTKDKSGIGTTYKVNDQYISKFENKTTNENYAKITNVAYGMYLIKGENPTIGRSYSVLTLSAVPEIQGPMGVYYLTGDLEATLKYADVTVDKRINEMEYDVVRTGETVTFEIAGEIPSYYPINGGVVYTKEDGDLYTGYDWNANYKFNITDDMSSAFTLDPSTVEIYLGDSLTEGGEWTAPPANSYTSLIASPYSTETGEGVVWFKDSTDKNGYYIIKHIVKNGNIYNLTWYIYNEKEGSIEVLQTGTANSEANATALPDASITSAYKAATGIQSVGTIARATSKNIFAISFDYSKLVAIDDEGKWAQIYKYVGLTYKATVTDDCLPGSQDNTNTVHLWYRSDIAGHYSSVDDTVRAYTYGMRIVKTDGESNPTKYLIGAQFNLYKEAFVYVPDMTIEGATTETFTAEPAPSNWQYYKFGRYAANGEYSAMEGIPTDDSETPVTLDTLDKLEEAGTTFEGGLNTYFRYVQVPAGTDDIDEPHYNVVVYKQMALADQVGVNAAGEEAQTVLDNTIYSIDTEEGVLIDGLEDASYVLIETVSPQGYNALTEAMRFEINKLSVEQHEMTENSAYDTDVIFYSANEVDPTEEGIVDAVAVKTTENEQEVIKYYQGYSDGIYGINVKNYQGLTLPSTGGIGTLIFTIIGIILMAAVIIVILAKRKKNSYM